MITENIFVRIVKLLPLVILNWLFLLKKNITFTFILTSFSTQTISRLTITKSWWSVNYRSHKLGWKISKLVLIAYEKCLLLEINTITMPLLFRIKYIIDRGCLLDDTLLLLFSWLILSYFISMHIRSYSFVY